MTAPAHHVVSLSLLALVSICACDGGPPPAVAGTSGGAGASGGDGASATRKVAVIAIESRRAGVKPFPFPVVDGRIGDRPTKLAIDTGASTHAIDRSLGADAAAKIAIEGWGDVPAHAAELVDLPPNVRARGIGGIVSPQLLVEQGQAVEVDLVNKQLRLRPKAMAWSGTSDVGTVMTTAGQSRPCADGSGQLLVVDVTVDGVPMRLALDTGSSRTIVDEGSAGAAKALAHPVLGRSTAQGLRADVATPLQGGVPLAGGAWSTTIDMGVAPGTRHPQCGHEGRIGIDILSYCAFAIAADDMLVACRALGQ